MNIRSMEVNTVSTDMILGLKVIAATLEAGIDGPYTLEKILRGDAFNDDDLPTDKFLRCACHDNVWNCCFLNLGEIEDTAANHFLAGLLIVLGDMVMVRIEVPTDDLSGWEWKNVLLGAYIAECLLHRQAVCEPKCQDAVQA